MWQPMKTPYIICERTPTDRGTETRTTSSI
jgi:hypothetical protein